MHPVFSADAFGQDLYIVTWAGPLQQLQMATRTPSKPRQGKLLWSAGDCVPMLFLRFTMYLLKPGDVLEKFSAQNSLMPSYRLFTQSNCNYIFSQHVE